MNLVFAGSSDFAVKSLDALIRAGHRVLAVLTQPDRPAGRRRRMTPTPVKAYARTAGLPVMAPESLKDEAVIEKLSRLEPELMVVVDYGLIIPRSVLELPSRGCINGHASLLPRWRGAAPVERAVMAGDRQTGITVMQMEAGLDTGPILLVRSTDIGPDESAGHLRDRLADICAAALVEALNRLDAGDLSPRRQNDSLACYAAKIRPEEARLDWRRTADELARQVRAFDPRPGAYTEYRGKRLKIIEAEPLAETSNVETGTVFRASRDGIDVAADDGVLRLKTIQLPGGKPMSAEAFLNGHDVLNERLGIPE
ncbi:MAG: methionyl-tRNA formyltransferase [Gammaproteobacteria bacterium]|jgi:methionyl-tRNA formyltransferase|nr:MAG: hypothetical protein AMJ59_11835 [Gammaproteobacteria bacterium SG8_31]